MTGGAGTSVMVRLMVFVAESGGEPLSVATTLMAYVPGPCPSDGVHEKRPAAASMVAPVGAFCSENEIRFTGISESVAVNWIVMGVSSATVWVALPAGVINVGALFCSLTTTSKLFVSEAAGAP